MDKGKEQLRRRLERAEAVLAGLRDEEVDAIVGRSGVSMLRFQEVERALRESEERLRIALDVAELACWQSDLPQGEISFDPRLPKMLGLSTEECPKRYEEWLAIIVEEDRERAQQAFECAMAAGESFDIELRVRLQSGEIHWLHTRGVPVSAPDGQCTRIVGVTADITGPKQTEEKLRALNDSLEKEVADRTAQLESQTYHLRRLADQLAKTEERERHKLANALHDGLQQLLVSARMHLPRFSEESAQTVESLKQILDEAIAASRSLSYELSPPGLVYSDLPEALKWLARWFHSNHRFQVDLEIQDNFPSLEEDTRTFLFATARELLLNAVKHSGSSGARLKLRTRKGKQVHLTVVDDGQGFDDTRLEPEEDDSQGFGLFSIRERLIMLGGNFDAHSQPGEGARFEVALPLDENQASPKKESVGPVEPRSGRDGQAPIRILIADDHNLVREGLISLLTLEDGVEIVGEACNGIEAIRQTEQLHPDVILMDVSMPRMSGIEATQQIKGKYPEVRIVGLSCHYDQSIVESMFQSGASAYLSKEDESETLVKTIRELC